MLRLATLVGVVPNLAVWFALLMFRETVPMRVFMTSFKAVRAGHQ